MIYYILPNLINNFDINQYILNKYNKNNIVFWGIDISFNYSSWNGNINNNRNNFQTLNNYLEIQQQINIPPLRLKFNNIQLENFDFFDEHMNKILQIFEDYGNTIELANLNLMTYIKKKYPKYNFTLSSNFFIHHTLDEININDFQLIQFPFNYDINLLQTFPLKEKIEIMINPICPYICSNINNCIISENLFQLEYSNFSPILQCIKNVDKNLFLNIIDIQKYLKININHFSFNDYSYFDKIKFDNFLLKYFFNNDDIIEYFKFKREKL